MRIGTWNLERGGNSRTTEQRQLSLIEELDLDVLIATEPRNEYSPVDDRRLRRRSGRG
jgi:hypothetical protein